MFEQHEIYEFMDGDKVHVIFKGTDQKRIERFKDYITIGMCMALSKNDDLLLELMDRCQELADDV